MILDILKAMLVGVCASVPVGPIAILVIQKSLSKGHKAGFITSLGSVFVDTVFSIIAIFALAFVQDFLARNHNWISLLGGIIVIILGASMAFTDSRKKQEKIEERLEGKVGHRRRAKASPSDFAQSVLMGLTNPGAILVIFALFAFFGIGATNAPHEWNVAPIVLGVASGSAIYWFLMTWLISRFSDRVDVDKMVWVNRITGVIVIIIGLAFLSDGLFRFIFPGKSLF